MGKIDKVKLGIVGLGRGGMVAEICARLPNFEITVMCDINPWQIEDAKRMLRRSNVNYDNIFFTDDYDELLRSDCNAVYVATYANLHVPFVIKALEAGKHVISEIPAVNSLEEAKELRRAVKKHPHLKYMAGENCNYWAFIQAWKQLYEEGRLGEAVFAEAEYLHSQDFREIQPPEDPNHWRLYNPAIHYITHELGPLLYITGDRCVSVCCMQPSQVYNPYHKQPMNEVAIFKMASGAVFKINIIFDAYLGFDHNFRIIGTRGTIETDRTKPLEEAHSFAIFSDTPGTREKKLEIPVTMVFPGEEIVRNGHGRADIEMMAAFVDCIINDKPSPIDVDMGIRMALPGIYAHMSTLQGGMPVEIPDPADFDKE